MVDKQARKSVAEHVVYCRRLDKLSVPFVEPLFRFITSGTEIPKPKMHLGIVKYGDQPQSITVDRWFYQGKDLYSAYNTKQLFLEDYPHGLYSVLPPYYTHGRYRSPRNWKFYMRLTKIIGRRFSRVAMLSAGIVAGSVMAAYIGAGQPAPIIQTVEAAPVVESKPEPAPDPAPLRPVATEPKPLTLAEKFEGMVIQGVAKDRAGDVIFVQLANGEKRWNLQTLRAAGYVVKMVSDCEVLLVTADRTESHRVYTSYCRPSTAPSQTPYMTKAQAKEWRWDQQLIDDRLNP